MRTGVDPKACRPGKTSPSALRAVIEALNQLHACPLHERTNESLELGILCAPVVDHLADGVVHVGAETLQPQEVRKTVVVVHRSLRV